MKMISALIVLLMLAAALWWADHNGYARCERAVEAAQQQQALNDQRALASMAPRQQQRGDDYAKHESIIRAVADPAGCADVAVPAGRVERLHDLYTEPARPGVDGAG